LHHGGKKFDVKCAKEIIGKKCEKITYFEKKNENSPYLRVCKIK
jgi:hypothetical protein